VTAEIFKTRAKKLIALKNRSGNAFLILDVAFLGRNFEDGRGPGDERE
jgi:hypothetical protein